MVSSVNLIDALTLNNSNFTPFEIGVLSQSAIARAAFDGFSLTFYAGELLPHSNGNGVTKARPNCRVIAAVC